jgi:recombinational DNA repair protein RecR
LKIESLGEFSGRYFVLGNINIREIEENLRIKILKERIKNSGVKEIVFAVGADYNGTYILNYLVEKVLSQYNISVYEVSIGVPLGYPLEFVDTNTLRWAFKYKRLVR